MKKIIILIFILTIFVIAILTNPNEKQHKELSQQKLEEIVNVEMSKYGLRKDMITCLAYETGQIFGKEILNQNIDSNNYILFSTTNLKWENIAVHLK
ncbi:hypothetical protein TRIP_D420122 [uncultured Paludibacter sp.]|uniref:Uncharacterized protein n=1 Tax=uncultured Paludibacter sp. TaxID=497635 RepID=A0A653AGS2_9BACT|nr:hypothetical protein TRIP_D420122 [uncultured Paludibacter sp.]